jgi:hypothetical protein
MGAARARRQRGMGLDAAVRYRYVITSEGTVEADTPAEAEAAAFEHVELGAGVTVCDIEPLQREGNEGT